MIAWIIYEASFLCNDVFLYLLFNETNIKLKKHAAETNVLSLEPQGWWKYFFLTSASLFWSDGQSDTKYFCIHGEYLILIHEIP